MESTPIHNMFGDEVQESLRDAVILRSGDRALKRRAIFTDPSGIGHEPPLFSCYFCTGTSCGGSVFSFDLSPFLNTWPTDFAPFFIPLPVFLAAVLVVSAVLFAATLVPLAVPLAAVLVASPVSFAASLLTSAVLS